MDIKIDVLASPPTLLFDYETYNPPVAQSCHDTQKKYQHEQKGFCSTAPRFKESFDTTANTPPSTRYNLSQRFSALQPHPESTSTKGSGTFASKSKRFPRRKIANSSEPGTYNLPSAFNLKQINAVGNSACMPRQIRTKGDDGRLAAPNRTKTPHSYLSHLNWVRNSATAATPGAASAVFRSKSRRSGPTSVKVSTPGPGQYDISDGSTYSYPSSSLSSDPHIRLRSRHLLQTSSFKSTAPRLTSLLSGSSPGPGTYNITTSDQSEQKQHILKPTSKCALLANTVAGKGCEAMMYSHHGQLNPNAAAWLSDNGSGAIVPPAVLFRSMLAQEYKDDPLRKSTPGPGTYDISASNSRPRQAFSCMFKSSTPRTELEKHLGSIQREDLPGPGKYQPEQFRQIQETHSSKHKITMCYHPNRGKLCSGRPSTSAKHTLANTLALSTSDKDARQNMNPLRQQNSHVLLGKRDHGREHSHLRQQRRAQSTGVLHKGTTPHHTHMHVDKRAASVSSLR